MMEGLSNELLTLFGLIGSNGVTWFFTRRKYNAEVENSVISNMKESLEFYGQFAEDVKKRLADMQEEISQLKQQIEEKDKRIDDLQQRLDAKQQQLEQLQNIIIEERKEKSGLYELTCVKGCGDRERYTEQKEDETDGKKNSKKERVYNRKDVH